MKYQILNSKGEAVKLTPQEKAVVNSLQGQYNNQYKAMQPGYQVWNATGYEIDITTLTQIIKSVTETKYHEVNFRDYVPVTVGEGAFSSQLLKYVTSDVAGDFETGVINTGAQRSKLAQVSTSVDAVHVPIINWAKEITYSLFDLRQAMVSGNWDLVSSQEAARYRNWNLGLQQIAFLGSSVNPDVKGLLTLSNVNSNTTLITQKISDMDATAFNGFISAVIDAYRSNGQRTVMPTHFIIPEDDYLGLGAFIDPSMPIKTKMDALLEVFRMVTRNPNFEILPSAYAMQSYNSDVTGLDKNRYVLLNYDSDSIRMDIPVDYTNTTQNTINGFQFQSVGFGQYAGVNAFRPLETLYFDWAAS